MVYRQVKELRATERTERLKTIREMFQKAGEYSDNKVQIAMQLCKVS